MKRRFWIAGILILLTVAFLLAACAPKNDQQEQPSNKENGKTEFPVGEKQGEPDNEQSDDTQTEDIGHSDEGQTDDQQTGNDAADHKQDDSPVIVLPRDHF